MYLPIIGLEIHVQPKTNSKMFCGCSADIFGEEPNTHTCPVCLGLPGALPVPNKAAIEKTVELGLALHSEIARESKFDRKNYFYPDLPKGYQISQYDQPFCEGGYLKILNDDTGEYEKIEFTRIHLEEDTGRLQHVTNKDGASYTLVDLNRSGMPLIEIVTEPVIHSPAMMKKFLKRLRQTLRHLGISDADMEKGTMRLEPNISVLKIENAELGSKKRLAGTAYDIFVPNSEFTIQNFKLPDYKVELKNINSFRYAEKATEFEIARHIAMLEKGEIPVQETRGWDEKNNVTVSQRRKENAHDYRYFPEPDIPPIYLDEDFIVPLRQEVASTPETIYFDLVDEKGLKPNQVEVLLEKPELLAFILTLSEKVDAKQFGKLVKRVINTPEVVEGKSVTVFLEEVAKEQADTIDDTETLARIVDEVIAHNPNEVMKYKEGNAALMGFFIGQVMTQTKGKADARVAKELLEKLLS